MFTFSNFQFIPIYQAKEKYRGVFEIQKSGDKTISGEIDLDIRTHASPKVGQDQVSGGVSIPCQNIGYLKNQYFLLLHTAGVSFVLPLSLLPLARDTHVVCLQ